LLQLFVDVINAELFERVFLEWRFSVVSGTSCRCYLEDLKSEDILESI
jgi:hypothetical protein